MEGKVNSIIGWNLNQRMTLITFLENLNQIPITNFLKFCRLNSIALGNEFKGK